MSEEIKIIESFDIQGIKQPLLSNLEVIRETINSLIKQSDHTLNGVHALHRQNIKTYEELKRHHMAGDIQVSLEESSEKGLLYQLLKDMRQFNIHPTAILDMLKDVARSSPQSWINYKNSCWECLNDNERQRCPICYFHTLKDKIDSEGWFPWER